MIIESRLSSDLAGGSLQVGGFFSGMVKQNGQKSDSIDEKRKTVHFQTHFSNAYKRSRSYAICDMHYKCILLRTYYGSDPNPCIMRYMQYDLMHNEQVYCNVLHCAIPSLHCTPCSPPYTLCSHFSRQTPPLRLHHFQSLQ